MPSKTAKHIIVEGLNETFEVVELPEGKEIELDLGCGKGSFCCRLAARHPERLFLAADVMLGRLRKLSARGQRSGTDNILPLRRDAWLLVGKQLPVGRLTRIHLLCPDPWPKSKHRKNRLMTSEFAARLHRALKPGGIFHFSTDAGAYFDDAVSAIDRTGLFTRDDTALDDIRDIKSDFEVLWESQGLSVRHAAWRSRPSSDDVKG